MGHTIAERLRKMQSAGASEGGRRGAEGRSATGASSSSGGLSPRTGDGRRPAKSRRRRRRW
ncbi:hypothetical protein [Oryza sativa Japonica Group]|uniref:Uncharacterized protein P0410E03.12 n=1 Tax=Oryza sativa subsp. japonica TaxID=39947 RepID=Q5ZE18_ORYSJ|nr:hypothetical protein [Oryza sativa Japonica Group]